MTLKYIKNVVSLKLDQHKCVGCGRCKEVCPHQLFEIKNKPPLKGLKAEIIDKDSCMECGACSKNCPVNAIYVDAGVGCAYASIKGKITGKKGCCC